MPNVFEEDGYKFFFYSNEHGPIHVHVRYGAGEAVFSIEPANELRESYGAESPRALEGAEPCGEAQRAYHSEVA
jgi:hypothetical protein